jgi:LEA14-like dessication related protein
MRDKLGFMRRTTAAMAGLTLLLCGCGLVRQVVAAQLRPPRFELASLSAEADLQGVTLLLGFQVENPNDVGLHLSGARYALELEGQRAVGGELPGGADFPARATAPLTVPVRVGFQDVPQLLTRVLGRSAIGYRVTGAAQLRTPIGQVEAPFEHSGRFTVPGS